MQYIILKNHFELIYSCAKTKGNTRVHKEYTRFKLGVHY